jgi:hypothetical protein
VRGEGGGHALGGIQRTAVQRTSKCWYGQREKGEAVSGVCVCVCVCTRALSLSVRSGLDST